LIFEIRIQGVEVTPQDWKVFELVTVIVSSNLVYKLFQITFEIRVSILFSGIGGHVPDKRGREIQELPKQIACVLLNSTIAFSC
jgi:hypothetical protein